MSFSTKAATPFDLHYVGLLRLGIATTKSRLSIRLWHQSGHVLRLGFGTSQVIYFDWWLAPAWECLSTEPGLSASVPLAGPGSQCGNERLRFILLSPASFV